MSKHSASFLKFVLNGYDNTSDDLEECGWIKNLIIGTLALIGRNAVLKLDNTGNVDLRNVTLPDGSNIETFLRSAISTRYNSSIQAVDFNNEWTHVSNFTNILIPPNDVAVTPHDLEHATQRQIEGFNENLHKIKESNCSLWVGDEVKGFKKCKPDVKLILETISTVKEKVIVLADLLANVLSHESACDMSSICIGNLGRERIIMPQVMTESSSALMLSEKVKDRDRGKYLSDNIHYYKYHKLIQDAIKIKGSIKNIVPLDDLWIPYLKEKGARVYENVSVRVGDIRCSQNEIKAKKTFGIAMAYLNGWSDLPKQGILCAAIVDDPSSPPPVNRSEIFAVDGHHRLSGFSVATSGNGMMNCKMIYFPKDKYDNMHVFYDESLKIPGILRFDLQDNNIFIPATSKKNLNIKF